MNMSKPKSENNNKALIFPTLDSMLPKTDKELTNTMASYYALQVALQTMKERCQQLQLRLSAVEDENLRLRIEKQRVSSSVVKEDSKGEISVLQEHIAQLTRQKSQLTHHIYMVATENKQLWTRLSRLTEANHSLGSQLSKISDTLSKHPLGEPSKPNQSIQIINTCEKDPGDVNDQKDKDESLEEISLKIISSIIREKMELEQQCDQMSALQTGTLSVEDCDFGGTLGESHDQELQDLRRVVENLRDTREQLTRHQAGLRATLLTLTSVIKNGTSCKKCKTCEKSGVQTIVNRDCSQVVQTKVTTVTEPLADPEDNRTIQGQEVEFVEDRICPLCGQFFPRTVPFEEFHSHVLTHFSHEDADYDSIVNNYEMVN
ncbi:protein spindle-F-like [Macrosteles quadrilineatus]|uniref:protein spindle-F-like n=1 Tax=Macrosteles quadrilineatus TaxID=74068 RepID=UPI0023E122FB|nr:protein spindle-F-like [Macrosteles quadrilineatus]